MYSGKRRSVRLPRRSGSLSTALVTERANGTSSVELLTSDDQPVAAFSQLSRAAVASLRHYPTIELDPSVPPGCVFVKRNGRVVAALTGFEVDRGAVEAHVARMATVVSKNTGFHPLADDTLTTPSRRMVAQ